MDDLQEFVVLPATGEEPELTIRWTYYSLTSLGYDSPFGVMRQANYICERYVPATDEWLEAATHWDYLIGREPGAREVSRKHAAGLIRDGHLAQIGPDAIR